MAQVKIEEKGCRGCTLCVDTCPTQVFDFVQAQNLATVARAVDCIGCYACYYLCPSQCIELSETHIQRPFYRMAENVALVEKFLQAPTGTTSTLTLEDWDEAYADVASTMTMLGRAITEMVGRGTAALGRKSGAVAAAHLPEMYEEKDLDGVLRALQAKLKHAFDFDPARSGSEISFSFHPCGLARVVEGGGDKVGAGATLCDLFHSYLAGLVGAYAGSAYRCEVQRASGQGCQLKLQLQQQ
jgi:2-oxoglutarate ferredoxin oxidoreductase subunit delta